MVVRGQAGGICLGVVRGARLLDLVVDHEQRLVLRSSIELVHRPGAGLSVGLDEEADLAQLPVRLRGVEELEVVAIGLELPVVDRVEVDVGLAQELGLAQVEVRQIATNGLGEAGGDLAPVEDSKHLLLGVVVDEGVEERLPVHFGQSVHASLLQFLVPEPAEVLLVGLVVPLYVDRRGEGRRQRRLLGHDDLFPGVAAGDARQARQEGKCELPLHLRGWWSVGPAVLGGLVCAVERL